MIKRKKAADPIADQAPIATPEDPAALLQAKLAEARNAVTTAKAAFGEAALDFSLAGNTDDAGEAARRKSAAAAALEQAQAHVLELQGALEAAEGRKARLAAAQAEQDTARRWAETRKHLADRRQAAADYAAACAPLVDAFKRFAAATEAARVACPDPKADLTASMFKPGDVEACARLELRRRGFVWAFPVWPSSVDQIPPLVDRIAGADGEALKRAPVATDAAP